VDIVVKGRNVEVPDHYRVHVAEKLQKVERYDQKLIRIDVELFHERNPRQHDHCQRVEITCFSRGPVVRAEACAQDFYAALDCAIGKLQTRLRRAADRRRVYRGRRASVSMAAATAGLPTPAIDALSGNGNRRAATAVLETAVPDEEPDDTVGYQEPWRVVREKEHPSEPMTVEDALFQMELVGHDFYLFLDKDSGRPSLVYRRKGYDYGVLSLAP
jgi:ribosomal subunit interface protein